MNQKDISMYEKRDRIFDFVYREAMEAATNRGGIQAGSKEQFLYLCNEELDEARIARNKVRNYVDEVLLGNNPDFYFYAELVTHALSQIDNGFCFGNAQKLINITIKYFYVMVYINEDRDIRDKFKYCHCPMDRIIICRVANEYKRYLKETNPPMEERSFFTLFVNNEGKPVSQTDHNAIPKATISAWKSIAWSQLNDDTRYIYDNFQRMVSKLCEIDAEDIFPIEFDYKYWK